MLSTLDEGACLGRCRRRREGDRRQDGDEEEVRHAKLHPALVLCSAGWTEVVDICVLNKKMDLITVR